MDTVFVSKKCSHRNVYHTDKDCGRLRKEPRVVTKEQATTFMQLPLCSSCSNERRKPNQNHDIVKAAIEATPDAI